MGHSTQRDANSGGLFALHSPYGYSPIATMTRHVKQKDTRRNLRDGEVARLYRKISQEADGGGYVLIAYMRPPVPQVP